MARQRTPTEAAIHAGWSSVDYVGETDISRREPLDNDKLEWRAKRKRLELLDEERLVASQTREIWD